MQSTTDILRIVIGDPTFSEFTVERSENGANFHLYRVFLPLDRFRGLPPEWLFAVLDDAGGNATRRSKHSIMDEVHQLAERHSDDLLFLISSVPSIRLSEDIAVLGNRIFCLEAPNIS